jgi:S-formylglutathione hydrolase FrmB
MSVGRRRAGTLLVALIGAAAAAGAAPAPAPLRTGDRRLVHDGRYRVLLPPDYPRAAPYPVLYFLHDILGDSAVLWRRDVAPALAAAMRSGAAPAVVVVAPDGGKGYWSDLHGRDRPYETWLEEDLRAAVEGVFAVRRERSGRAVSGVSMGGFGAVKAALRRPDLYASAASVSGVLFQNDWDLLQSTFWLNRWALKRVFGWTRADNSFARNDIFRLAAAADPALTPPFILRCGRADKYRLAAAATVFHQTLEREGFASNLRLEDGGHDWDYWRQAVLETLVEQAWLLEGRSS